MKNLLHKELQKTVPLPQLDTWFTPLCMDFDEKTHTLSVTFPHAFFQTWFMGVGKQLFEKAACKVSENIYGSQAHITYISPQSNVKTPSFRLKKKTSSFNEKAQVPCISEGFYYNTKNTFLIQAANKVTLLEKPLIYNPFIMYGKSGTGKTHLLKNMYTILLTQVKTGLQKDFHVFFGSAESLWECLRDNAMHAFFHKYTAFVIDDIHRIPAEEKVHENFATFIDMCFENNKQLIFTSLYSPKNKRTFHETVCSRFHKGLITEIKSSDIDVRMRYALAHSRDLGLKLSRDHLLLLAQRCEYIPFLSGIILKIHAFASFSHIDVTTTDLENIIASSGGEKKQLQAQDIILFTAAHFSLQKEDLLGNKRLQNVVKARQIALYLCKELMGLSSPALGKIFGGRDHSTVIHSIKKIKQLLETDKETYLNITQIKKKIFT